MIAPPLVREHRLYQADWLLRFYGFGVDEIAPVSGNDAGMLDLHIDPKLAWAIRNRAFFPVNLNRAPFEMLMRILALARAWLKKSLNSGVIATSEFMTYNNCGYP